MIRVESVYLSFSLFLYTCLTPYLSSHYSHSGTRERERVIKTREKLVRTLIGSSFPIGLKFVACVMEWGRGSMFRYTLLIKIHRSDTLLTVNLTLFEASAVVRWRRGPAFRRDFLPREAASPFLLYWASSWSTDLRPSGFFRLPTANPSSTLSSNVLTLSDWCIVTYGRW